MACTEIKISKQGAAGTIQDITLTIPETFEIIRKLGSATNQSIIMAAYDTEIHSSVFLDISYMELIIYLHLLCKYFQTTKIVQTLPPTHHPKKKNKDRTYFHSQQRSCFNPLNTELSPICQ